MKKCNTLIIFIFSLLFSQFLYAQCTLACYAEINVSLDASGNASLTVGEVLYSSDPTCGTLTLSPSTFDCSDIGEPITVWVTDDLTGNACWSEITIEDKISPSITCIANLIVSLPESGSLTLGPGDLLVSESDNCPLTYDISPAVVDCSNLGAPFIVTITATDPGGNSVSCSTNVEVQYNHTPTMACIANVNVALGAGGTTSLTPDMFLFSPPTDCLNLSINPASVSCSDIGSPITVLITDLDSGNACFSTVNVEDKTGPLVACEAAVNVSLDASGNAALTPAMFLAFADDNCDLTYSVSPSSVNCSDIGSPVTVILTATDPGGNSNSCFTSLTVEDKTAPTISCNAVTNVQLGSGGTLTLDPTVFLSSASDNCDLTYSISPSTVDCSDKNNNVNVTIIASDASGNTSSCSGLAFVEDPKPLSCSINVPSSITCGETGVGFSVNVSGGNGPYVYEWLIKGNTNGWSITSGQGTDNITMDVGIKKIKLEVTISGLCGKKIKCSVKPECNEPSSYSNITISESLLSDVSSEQLNRNQNIHIYPNPVSDYLNVEFVDLNVESKIKISVFNQLGKLMIEKYVSKNLEQIDLSPLPEGAYLLIVNHPTHEKLIKRIIKF